MFCHLFSAFILAKKVLPLTEYGQCRQFWGVLTTLNTEMAKTLLLAI